MVLAKAPMTENSCINFIIVTNTKHIDKLIVMLKLLESWWWCPCVCKFSKKKETMERFWQWNSQKISQPKCHGCWFSKEIKCQAMCQKVDDGTPPNVVVSSPNSMAWIVLYTQEVLMIMVMVHVLFLKKKSRLKPLTMPLMMKKEMLLWFLHMVVM